MLKTHQGTVWGACELRDTYHTHLLNKWFNLEDIQKGDRYCSCSHYREQAMEYRLALFRCKKSYFARGSDIFVCYEKYYWLIALKFTFLLISGENYNKVFFVYMEACFSHFYYLFKNIWNKQNNVPSTAII